MKASEALGGLPAAMAFSAEGLARTLSACSTEDALKVATVLKEASIRDQNFEQASAFRCLEKFYKKSRRRASAA